MSLIFPPMPLLKRRLPFDDPDWLFELKYDGFRAIARIKSGRCQLIFRNGNPFASFSDLAEGIASALPLVNDAVLDGEIVCLDKRGRPQFKNLLFPRGEPCFFAFDLLWNAGKDLRLDRLLDRKHELNRLLNGLSPEARVCYVDHVDGLGIALFERVCKSDLEGIVAKDKHAPYVSDPEQTTWLKIRNPRYSQWEGRQELFERDRHSEPVAGWHSCAIACAKAEAAGPD
jgi:bifunctional non-homologous end joining protein LigD